MALELLCQVCGLPGGLYTRVATRDVDVGAVFVWVHEACKPADGARLGA